MKLKEQVVLRFANGTAEWFVQEGDRYLVTGVDRSGHRFARGCPDWFMARCINLWHGSRWLIRDGKRYLLTRQ